MRGIFFFLFPPVVCHSVDLLEGFVMYCSGFGGIHYIMYTCIREQPGTLLVKLIILHIYLLVLEFFFL